MADRNLLEAPAQLLITPAAPEAVSSTPTYTATNPGGDAIELLTSDVAGGDTDVFFLLLSGYLVRASPAAPCRAHAAQQSAWYSVPPLYFARLLVSREMSAAQRCSRPGRT